MTKSVRHEFAQTAEIRKHELRIRVVPLVRRYLQGELGLDLGWYDPIFTHATSGEHPATVVWEGTQWAYEFCDTYEGEYEIEPMNSYEISVRRWEG